jgi:hypothetical protein
MPCKDDKDNSEINLLRPKSPPVKKERKKHYKEKNYFETPDKKIKNKKSK